MTKDKLVLSQNVIDGIIDKVLLYLDSVPREYSVIMDYVLNGFNIFSLEFFELKKINNDDLKKAALVSLIVCKDGDEMFFGKYDKDKEISIVLPDYWVSLLEKENLPILERYEICLLISGMIAFFNTYERLPKKQKIYIDLCNKMKRVLEADIKETGVANIKKLNGCIPSWFWVPLTMAVDLCIYLYSQHNVHPELDELFNDYNTKFDIDFDGKTSEQVFRELWFFAYKKINILLDEWAERGVNAYRVKYTLK